MLDVETVCSASENLEIVQLTVTCFQQALCPVNRVLSLGIVKYFRHCLLRFPGHETRRAVLCVHA